MPKQPFDAPEDERIVAEAPDFPPPGAERGPTNLSGFTLHMVGHAHIDLGYRWNQAETVHYVAPWTFGGVLDLMERTPGFTFCQSQMYLYEAMRRQYPEIFQRIKDAISRGRWEIVGGAWCEYDAILPSGESVIRQHLLGVRYAADVLGVDRHEVAFVPDSFCGHAATLPQILAGCGFRYYVFGRGLPQDPEAPEKTRRAFRWCGPDGSNVVAYLPFGPYATPPLTTEFLDSCLPYVQASVSPQELVLYGQGDHGGGPRDPEIQALQALGGVEHAPQWRFSTVHELCRDALSAAVTDGLTEHRGNLGGFATGALTSQAPIKRRNRILEKRLLAAEATAVIGTLLSRKPAFPRVEARQLWRMLLTEQFHDILPGTSVASVYRDSHAAYNRVEEGAARLLEDGFDRIRSRLDTRGEGVTVVAYNPGLTATRTPVTAAIPDWVRMELQAVPLRQPQGVHVGQQRAARPGQRQAVHPGQPAAVRMADAAGAEVPCHVDEHGLTFLAELPSLGYGTFRLTGGGNEAAPERAEAAPTWDGRVLQSDRFRLRFDPDSGDLNGFQDRRDGTGILAGPSNTLDLYREMSIATSWVHALTGDRQPLELVKPVHAIRATPLFTRVSTTSRSRFSTFTREVTVYADSDRVDFHLFIDWHEGNAFLKLGFAPDLHTPTVRAALAHGCVPVEDPAREFCMHDFVDLRDGQRGLALFNDGAYGASFADGRLGISVIRTVRDMDPQMGHGRHELHYSLLPHGHALTDDVLWQHGGAAGTRPLCAFEPEHPGGIKSWGRFDNSQALPPAQSFVEVREPGAVLCAFKMPAEDWLPLSFVVRVREVNGTGGDFTVALPVEVVEAVEADHLERATDTAVRCQGRELRVHLEPWQIKTVVARV